MYSSISEFVSLNESDKTFRFLWFFEKQKKLIEIESSKSL